MKTNNNYYSLSLLLLILLYFSVEAKDFKTVSNESATHKTGSIDSLNTLSNINNLAYWLSADGESGHNPYEGVSGGIYPRGTAAIIYADGCVWGAKVNGNIKVGGQTYLSGTQSSTNRIFRIRKDCRSLTSGDVKEEAAEFFNITTYEVTELQAQSIIDQYKENWKNWPVEEGAPFVDVDYNGSYNPVLDGTGLPDASLGDYPGLIDVDQVIWFKVNDLDTSKTRNLYGSDPLGIEMQVTVWGYNQRNSKLGQAIFKKYKIKNISTDTFEEMYLSQFSDADIGEYSNDLVGCDPDLECAYAYNGQPVDYEFSNYGINPPACGYTLLQGPIVPSPGDTAFFDHKMLADYRNLSMSSFGYFVAGGEWSLPKLGDYNGTLQWYNLLRGNIPTSDIANPTPFTYTTGSNQGQTTKFPLNGDPENGTGDVDGKKYSASDRRLVLVSGPFTMHPGDIQEMVVAVVGGIGNDNLNSVRDLKETINFLQAQALPTKIDKNKPMISESYLLQNYPNPFNPKTTISFKTIKRENVELVIFDVLGREIKTLNKKYLSPGKHSYVWDGKNSLGKEVSSGIYFYQVKTNSYIKTNKMVLLR